MKVIFPTLWIAGFGIGTLLLFLRSADANGNPPPEHVKWQFLVLWLAGTGFIWWGCVRLKRVRVDDALLYISNYRREITVPLSQIRTVAENRWINIHPVTIEFWVPTAFGERIVFMPQAASLFTSHPVVGELQSLVARVTGVAPRDAVTS